MNKFTLKFSVDTIEELQWLLAIANTSMRKANISVPDVDVPLDGTYFLKESYNISGKPHSDAQMKFYITVVDAIIDSNRHLFRD